MSETKEKLKKYLLVKYTEAKLKECNKGISKSIPWIQKKTLTNTIETHCRVLLNTLLNKRGKQSLRENKFIIDSIFEYTLKRSENLLKTKKKVKDIKTYMQLNSYIVFEEIEKGLTNKVGKKTITYNIEKQLAKVREQTNEKQSPQEILEKLFERS